MTEWRRLKAFLRHHQGKHLFSFIFLVCGGKEWSSANTLGPILKRKTPKCAELNYLQFYYKFINIWSTSSINFFKKPKQNECGWGWGKPSPPTPLNPQKISNGQSSWPANFLQEYPKILASYYNARDLAIFKTSTVKKFSFKKWSISKCHPLNSSARSKVGFFEILPGN